MSPRPLLRLLMVVSLVGLLAPAAALPSGITARIEGESGAPLDAGCSGDGESMGVALDGRASGGRTMFFPEALCEARYSGEPGVARVTHLRFYMTGEPGRTYCGQFVFRGGYVGASEPACGTNGVLLDADVVSAPTTPRGAPSFLVMWAPSALSPTWVNGFLDYMTVEA